MPVQECTENGRPGYRWGALGRCYPYDPADEASRSQARAQAEEQGRAIQAAQARRENEIEAVAWYTEQVQRLDGAEPPVRVPVSLDVTALARRSDARRKPGKLPPYPMAIERRYERLLLKWIDRMAKTMLVEIDKVLPKTEIQDRAKRKDTAAGDPRALLRVIAAVDLAARASAPGTGEVETIGADVARWTDAAVTGQVAALVGLELTGVRGVTNPLIRSWTRQNAILIKTLQGRFIGEIQQLARSTVELGKSTKWFRDRIQRRWQVSRSRAQLIARDQASKLNGQVTMARQQSLGIRKFVWRTVGDDRVRDEHEAIDGRVYEWPDGHPTEGIPGEPVQCFPGSTQIVPLNGAVKLFRRRYHGELTTLVTVSGVSLHATPNHPILTLDGWKAAQSINVGDHLVEVPKQLIQSAEPDERQAIPIGDAFDSCAAAFGFAVRPGAGVQFHGDGLVDQQVDVISVERGLLPNIDPAITQMARQLILSAADEVVSPDVLPRSCTVAARLVAGWTAPDRIVRGLSVLFALRGCHLRHADPHGLAAVAKLDAVFREAARDAAASNAELLAQFEHARTTEVQIDNSILVEVAAIRGWTTTARDHEAPSAQMLADNVGTSPDSSGGIFQHHAVGDECSRVIDVGVADSSCHVYNLECDRHWYVAGGYVVHNCRCSAEAVIE